jgi:hypothetical protein
MSNEERVSWVALIVNIVVGGLYFGRIFAMPADANLFGPRTAAFAAGLVTLAVVVAIATQVALQIVQKLAQGGSNLAARDERDDLIELKATRNGFYMLGFALICALAQVAITEWTPLSWRAGPWRAEQVDTVLELILTGPMQTMQLANLVLLAMTLGAITVNASRVCYYRRDG